jgi:hypothetical protein
MEKKAKNFGVFRDSRSKQKLAELCVLTLT